MARPLRSAIAAAATAVALALTGCIQAPGAPGAGAPALAELFESAGVVIAESVDDLDAIGTAPIVLLPEHVASMAAEADAGSGLSGSDLDAFAPVDSQAPPMAFLLGAWASEYDGPGAVAARELLPEGIDWDYPEHVLWPRAVLTLYLADLTADLTPDQYALPRAEAPTTPAALASVRQDAGSTVGAICDKVSGFVQLAIGSVYEALEEAAKVAEQKAGGGLFGKIVGLGVRAFGLLVDAALDVVNGVTSAVLGPVRAVLEVVAIINFVGALLQPWVIRMSVAPNPVVAGAGWVTGVVHASVDQGVVLKWPEWIEQCANAIGVSLPPPPGHKAQVTWGADYVSALWGRTTASHGNLGEDNTAELEFRINPEPPETWGGESYQYYSLRFTMQPHRDEVTKLNTLADTLITAGLQHVPVIIRGIVARVVERLRAPAVAALERWLTPGVTGNLTVPLVRHFPKDEEPVVIRVPDPSANFLCEAYASYGDWIRNGGIDELFDAHFDHGFGALVAIGRERQDPLVEAARSVPAIYPSVVDAAVYASVNGVSSISDLDPPRAQRGSIEVAQWAMVHCSKGQLERIHEWYRFLGFEVP